MIKAKYKKGVDISQLARSIVERATGVPLTSPKAAPDKKNKIKPNRKQR